MIEDDRPRFLLIVRTPPDAGGGADLATWTGRLQQEERLVDAAPVTASERFGSVAEEARSLPIDAYMILHAANLAEARQIARTAPALASGGSVEIAALRR